MSTDPTHYLQIKITHHGSMRGRRPLTGLQPLLEPTEAMVARPEAAQGGGGVAGPPPELVPGLHFPQPPRFTPDQNRFRTASEQDQNPTQTNPKNAPKQKTRPENAQTHHTQAQGGGGPPHTHTAEAAHAETAPGLRGSYF